MSPRTLLITLGVLLQASSAAAGEPRAVDESPYSSTVVGEGARLPNSNGGSSVVLSSQDLERLPAGADLRLSEVLLTQSGLTADAFGQVHVRGHYAHLLYRLDGVPLPPTLVDQFEALISTRAIQSLELMAGGLRAEIGGQVGGVVDLQLKDFEQPSGAASFRYASDNSFEPSLVYGRTIGKLSFFVAGDYLRTDRGLDPPSPSILHDQAESGHALAHLTYRIGPRDTLRLNVAFVQATYQLPINASLKPVMDGERADDVYGNSPNPFVPYDANPTEFERDILVTLSHRHRFGDGSALQTSLYLRAFELDLKCDPARALGPTADPGSACSDVLHDLFHVGAVADYAVPIGRRHELQAGFWLDEQQSEVRFSAYSRNDDDPTQSPDPQATLRGEDRTSTTYVGVYFQDRIRLGPVTLFPGVRLDLQDTHATGSGAALLLYSPSARLGATWAWSRRWSLHAYVGYLWQPPSLDAPTAGRVLGLIPAGQPVVYDLQAEGDGYAELGVTGRPLPGITMSLTAWGRLMDHPIDDEEVGDTNLKAEYNYEIGRAYGLEYHVSAVLGPYFSAMANLTVSRTEGQGIATARYLFTDQQLADHNWQPFDHDQTLTANLAFDVHDRAQRTHLSGYVHYGSGLRTGASNQWRLPAHETIDISLRHEFQFFGHPEIAIDVRNLLDEVYALRIGNGSLAGSAYGAPRRFGVRISVPLTF